MDLEAHQIIGLVVTAFTALPLAAGIVYLAVPAFFKARNRTNTYKIIHEEDV